MLVLALVPIATLVLLLLLALIVSLVVVLFLMLTCSAWLLFSGAAASAIDHCDVNCLLWLTNSITSSSTTTTTIQNSAWPPRSFQLVPASFSNPSPLWFPIWNLVSNLGFSAKRYWVVNNELLPRKYKSTHTSIHESRLNSETAVQSLPTSTLPETNNSISVGVGGRGGSL